MNPRLPVLLLLAGLGTALHAQDAGTGETGGDAAAHGGWTGSGEFGFAAARGNSHTENANAKLTLGQENAYWRNNFFLNGLRSKGDVEVQDAAGNTVDRFSTTANRYDAGASVGYKLDPRSYVVTAARYEHDDFGANLWQGVVSVGYGYIALKSGTTELSFEIGPGYKRYRPADLTEEVNGVTVKQHQSSQGEGVARGLVNLRHRLSANTTVEETLLAEAGSDNQYYQNDLSLSVSMTRQMALKLGYQVRYNSDVLPGVRHTDTLTTTNLVYNF